MPGPAKTPHRQPHHVAHTLESILAKCDEDAGCWIWKGGLGHGVPTLSVNRKTMPVRRYIAQHLQGRRVAGLLATSSCMNPLCVSPDCLVLVTRAQLQKMWANHLGYHHNPVRNAKIAQQARANSPHSDETVALVRQMSETLTQREISRRLGLNFDFVNKVIRNKLRRDYAANPWAGLLAA